MIGQTISHYKVVRKLGTGGMGIVYEAQDLNLNRPVALKFLPEELSADRESLERFNREARAASSLNHPNICTVYEIGEFAGKPFLAMELLQGETLGQRVRNKPLTIDEIIDFGMQLANALQAAHAKGIVHRDIKSANLFVTSHAQIKILDFGLAKQFGERENLPAGGDASTADSFTTSGAIVGTLDYMSPEQVLGEKLDGRSDLFSLGIVLYYMATGHPPFTGSTPAAVCNSILHKKPTAPCRLNPEVPEGVERVIDKLLEKDRDLRYQTAGELAADLKRLKRDSDSVAPSVIRAGKALSWRKVLLGIVGVGVAISILWTFRSSFLKNGSPKPTANSSSPWMPLTNFADSAFSPALSRDGHMLAFFRGSDAFFGSGQIYVKLLPDGEPTKLTNDDLLKMDPVFSPDGSRVAYSVPGSWDTWVVPLLDGKPKLFLPNAAGLSWMADKRLLFSEIKKGLHMGLVTSNESRSDVRDVYLPARERGMVHRSYLSPDGKFVLLAEMDNGGWRQCRVVPFDGSSSGVRFGPSGSACTTGAWSPDGKFVYFSSDAGGGFHIWRQGFPEGAPEQITSGPSEEDGIAMAPDGQSFVTSVGLATSTVWIHDGKGERQTTSQGFAGAPRFSPDGSKLYYLMSANSASSFDFSTGKLWVADLRTERSEPVLEDFAITRFDLSKDGGKIVFASTSGEGTSHIWLGRLDKRSGPRQITSFSGEDSPVFGPGGLIFFRASEGGFNYIYRMREDGSERQKVIPDSIFEFEGVSPDGNMALALTANSDEDSAITTSGFQLNHNGAHVRICYFPCGLAWSTDGKLLYVNLPVRMNNQNNLEVFAIELPNGKVLPKLPASGLRSKADLAGLKIITIHREYISPGPNPSVYAFRQKLMHHNLYRVPIP